MSERAVFGVHVFLVIFLFQQKMLRDGVKVSVTRWLSRFFLVISVDAARRALGRDTATFSCQKRRAPASTRQNGPFSPKSAGFCLF